MVVLTGRPTVLAYLLVQKGKILDVNPEPHKLNFNQLNEFNDWSVYAGCKNEFGEKEIAGSVAKVWCKSSYGNYVISVRCADYESKINCVASESPSTIVACQLQRMHRQRQISDPANLGEMNLFTL